LPSCIAHARMKSVQLAGLAALAALAAEASAFAPGHAPTERTPATRRSACAVHMKTRGPDHVGRRAVLALAALPALGLRRASAAAPSEAAELQRLRDEAARIQEIFDVQKELNSNMPSLKDGLKAAKGAGADVEQTRVARAADSVPGTTVDMQNVVAVIDTMMAALKKEGQDGMKVVLEYTAPSNPIKSMPLQNVISTMRDGKYNVLFGNFVSYEIKKPEVVPVDPDEFPHSSVDVVVKAPFDVMVQNGMQFEDMKMPSGGSSVKLASRAEAPSKNLCTATFRWVMRKEKDGTWTNEGCYVVPVETL